MSSNGRKSRVVWLQSFELAAPKVCHDHHHRVEGAEKATNQVLGIHATQTFSKTADVKTGGFGNIDRLLFCSSKIMHKQRDGLICIVLLPLGLLYDCCITSLAAALESHLDKVEQQHKLGSISHHYHHLKQLVTS